MAYVDRSSNTRRTTTAIAVALIQAGVIYAVATGLAVTFMPPPKPADPPDATNIPITPITPDKPEKAKPPIGPETKAHERKQITPTDTTIFEPTDTDFTVPTGPIGIPGGGSDFFEKPQPDPVPSFAPRVAKPRNAPSSWATTNDYPTRDIREGNEGLTRFRLSISADGKVLDCQVTGSSGFAGLDSATCDKVSRRARFNPATDSSGNTVPGTYSGSIRWQIPD